MGFASDCSNSASNTSVFLLALMAAAWNTTHGVLQEFWWFYLVPSMLSLFHLSVSLSLSLTHTIHNIFELYSMELPLSSLKVVHETPIYVFHLTGSASFCIYELDSMTHWGRPPRLLTTRLYCLVSLLPGLRKESILLDNKMYYYSCF